MPVSIRLPRCLAFHSILLSQWLLVTRDWLIREKRKSLKKKKNIMKKTKKKKKLLKQIMRTSEQNWLRRSWPGGGRNTLQYWRTQVSQSVSVPAARVVSIPLPSEFLSLYSLFGEGHYWHWVQEGSLRVPLPSRNCRTRSTSRATTKSTTRTWAIISLNCKRERERTDIDFTWTK